MHRVHETMSELWRHARAEVALPDQIKAVCNMGCHPDLWPDLGEHLFEHIRKHQPDVALSVWHGGQTELATWTRTGLIDLSLTYWPAPRATHRSQTLTQDRLVLVSDNPQAPVRFDPGYVFVEAGEAFGRWQTGCWRRYALPALARCVRASYLAQRRPYSSAGRASDL